MSDSRIKAFIDFAFTQLKSELEITPSINYKACGTLLKSRLAECELDEMKDMLTFALNGGTDAFWRDSGYSLQVFLAPTTFQRIRLNCRRHNLEKTSRSGAAFIPFDAWKQRAIERQQQQDKESAAKIRAEKERI